MDALTQRLSEAAEALAGDMPAPDQVRHAAEHARRVRRAAVGSAAAALLLVLALGVGVLGDGAAPQLSPAKPPGLVVGTVPVWYDAAGLHRGDVVEPTAVDLLADDWRNGQLALVRSGALYRDTATNDVWFHPWGGEPSVVGHDSGGGPGGDPQSDIAAWFEDDELVVYDTASGRELSRTVEVPTMPDPMGEHFSGGNGFRHVSATEVVWRTEGLSNAPTEDVHRRLDVATGFSTILATAPPATALGATLLDVHGSTRVWGDVGSGEKATPFLVVEGGGGEELRLDGLEPLARLSGDGRFVLAPTGGEGVEHGAAIVDVRSGEIWTLPGPAFYAGIAWSYGDMALVTVGRDGADELLMACDAVTRACDQLRLKDGTVLPTS